MMMYENLFRQEIWEELQDELLEIENEVILDQLNKLHNRRGYTTSDYQNNYDEY